MILEPRGGVTGSHGNRKRMGLISRWSAPWCRLPVRADIRVLDRKDIQFNSRYIGHVAARAHLGPCERPKGRNNEILRKG